MWARGSILLSAVALLGATLLGGVQPDRAEAADPLPGTVPSVRQATAGTGAGFAWTATGRIVAEASLANDARTLAEDLAGIFEGRLPQVVTGAPGSAQPGDITLALGSTDTQLGEEGYTLAIGPTLNIQARTSTGAFWGTRTVLQMLRQRATLPAYTVKDWPKFKVRAVSVSLDQYPAGWFVNLVRDLSFVKLNELTTGSALAGLSDDQLRTIQAAADKYHVKFVGWFNTPHYNNNVPAAYQLRVANQAGTVVAPDPATLDLTKPAAIKWATDQIEHYMDIQTTPIWHAGGDEYPKWYLRNNGVTATNAPDLYAVAKQRYPTEQYPAGALYNQVFNDLNDIAKQHGKQLRMWSDSIVPTTTVKLDPDITIDHWFKRPPSLEPAQFAAAGNHLINSNQQYLYYNEGAPQFPNATDTALWSTFDPGEFNGGLRLPGGADDPHLDGIKLNTWHGSMHLPPAPMENNLLPLTRPLAERAWAPAKPTSTIATARILFKAIGRAPGFVQTPATGATNDPWDPGKSSLPGSPAVGYNGSQQVFFVNAAGQLRHRFWSSGQPVKDELLTTAVTVAGRPLAYVSSGQLHVWVRGTNGSLQHVWWDPTANRWANDDWTAKSGAPLGSFTGDLAGYTYGPHQHIFARGTDNKLRHIFWDANQQKVLTDVWGGEVAGSPVAYAWGRTQNVFAVAPDGTLRQWSLQGTDLAHRQYRNLGGTFPADARPAALGFFETRQDVVLRDGTGRLRLWSYDHKAGTSSWRDLTTETGVTVTGNPVEYSFGVGDAGSQYVWVRRASDNHLLKLSLPPAGGVTVDDWTGTAIGGPATAVADPYGFNSANDQQHVWATDSAGKMHHWFWKIQDGKVYQDLWG